jgi:rfaE bifunctional protein nucleotidyltransferase chain/domain
VTPNQVEAAHLVPEIDGCELDGVHERARTLARRWNAAVAVTLGGAGALLVQGEAPTVVVPTERVHGDPCGAGDCFASAVAGGLADGLWLRDAVAHAVARATAFVRDGGAGAFSVESALPPVPAAEGADAVVARVRAEGGTVVATGGCFDLLHAGHVATLEAARALGDCLVVCLNSDESVRRLKGSDRPLVPEEDRVALLRALGSVDAVVVFDDDTPQAALERLRPDMWAKGGDYALEELPEAELVARWGGRAVILPYVEGRSTTRLLEDIALRVH